MQYTVTNLTLKINSNLLATYIQQASVFYSMVKLL